VWLARISVVLACAVVLGGVPVAPVFAAPSDTGTSSANLGESDGCAPGIAGPRRPETWRSGYLGSDVIVSGPWGDTYGRSRGQVTSSLVDWRIFGTNQTVRIHERMIPAAQQVDAGLAQAMSDGNIYSMPAAAAWVWRTVGGTLRFSEHAFGTAVDINPGQNPYSRSNVLITNMPSWFVDVWTDAGFCWGGFWVTVKDAMHYSWSGPGMTDDYPGRLRPFTPLTGVVPFDRIAIDTTTTLGSVPGATFGVGDFSGDGAGDLFRLRPFGSGTRLEVVGSTDDFTATGLRVDLATSPSGPLLVADLDLDGRPDVWQVDRSGSAIQLRVWTSLSGYSETVILTTGVGSASGDDYSLTLWDDDYAPDLIVFDRSGPTTADVYTAASGYGTKANTWTLTAADTRDPAAWAILAGDWDVDGKTDLYAVEKGPAPIVHVATGSGASAQLGSPVAISASAEVLISDYDGDGRDDLYVRDGSRLRVLLGGLVNASADLSYWYLVANPVPWDAGPECIGPDPCDSIGFADSGGVWKLADAPSSTAGAVDFFYGNPGDAPFSGDWDCDGVDTPGLYRRSDGYVYLRNTNTQGIADISFFFGNPGDVPLIGDFNGDGCDTVSIYRPAAGRFYIINRLGSSDTGLGAADFHFDFGNIGDHAIAGDWDGDGVDGIGLHRPGSGYAYLRNGLSAGAADHAFYFGDAGDVALVGDWNGNGVDSLGVFRASDGNWYLKLTNATGMAEHSVHFHAHNAVTRPVVGRFATSSEG